MHCHRHGPTGGIFLEDRCRAEHAEHVPAWAFLRKWITALNKKIRPSLFRDGLMYYYFDADPSNLNLRPQAQTENDLSPRILASSFSRNSMAKRDDRKPKRETPILPLVLLLLPTEVEKVAMPYSL